VSAVSDTPARCGIKHARLRVCMKDKSNIQVSPVPSLPPTTHHTWMLRLTLALAATAVAVLGAPSDTFSGCPAGQVGVGKALVCPGLGMCAPPCQ
jgi:hypothetical protein